MRNIELFFIDLYSKLLQDGTEMYLGSCYHVKVVSIKLLMIHNLT